MKAWWMLYLCFQAKFLVMYNECGKRRILQALSGVKLTNAEELMILRMKEEVLRIVVRIVKL